MSAHGLPNAAWAEVIAFLSPEWTDYARRSTLLALRAASPSLCALVALWSRGGLGIVDAADLPLAATTTASMGTALCVHGALTVETAPHDAVLDALTRALGRGHVVEITSACEFSRAQAIPCERVLLAAAAENLLKNASLRAGPEDGWDPAVLAQLPTLELAGAIDDVDIAALTGHMLQSLKLESCDIHSTQILRGLAEVTLHECHNLGDLGPLADVRRLELYLCSFPASLPPMRNDILWIDDCFSLADVSGLAEGRVRCLGLVFLESLTDVSPIGLMHPPPQSVTLSALLAISDVATLRGIGKLVVQGCPRVDEQAACASLGSALRFRDLYGR